MSKYRCVPEKWTNDMQGDFYAGGYVAMLAAAPPPPADIAEALEHAKLWVETGPQVNTVTTKFAVALLKSWDWSDYISSRS